MKPSVVVRIQEILILSSVHPQRIRGGPKLGVFWGASTEWKQSKMCCK